MWNRSSSGLGRGEARSQSDVVCGLTGTTPLELWDREGGWGLRGLCRLGGGRSAVRGSAKERAGGDTLGSLNDRIRYWAIPRWNRAFSGCGVPGKAGARREVPSHPWFSPKNLTPMAPSIWGEVGRARGGPTGGWLGEREGWCRRVGDPGQLLLSRLRLRARCFLKDVICATAFSVDEIARMSKLRLPSDRRCP